MIVITAYVSVNRIALFLKTKSESNVTPDNKITIAQHNKIDSTVFALNKML